MNPKSIIFVILIILFSFLGCPNIDRKIDDWNFSPKDEDNDFLKQPRAVPSTAAEINGIGFSTGGAKDIGNFRENIKSNYLPILTDITYEGLFYNYYFETGETEKCDKLFCPSYSYSVSNDPFSKEKEYYLSVGLNSGMKESDFKRKKLNIVVVLDMSGSMGSSFDKYYYDKFGNKNEITDENENKSKIEIATHSVNLLIDHLSSDDRFGMILFDDQAYKAKALNLVKETDIKKIKDHILEVKSRGGTDMEAGYNLGTSLFDKYKNIDKNEYENRIIFLTDAMPNTGETSEGGLLGMTSKNANEGIFTTFIGIGVDFNTSLTEIITKIRGANYYSVHSEKLFKEVLDEGFDFMVTPLVFDLKLSIESGGYKIEKVYGSPEANESTGEIMKINTLFPSKTKDGETKGGIVLLKMTKSTSDNQLIKLKVTYSDRTGKQNQSEKEFKIEDGGTDIYPNTGIRKGILLSRFVNLMKNWIIDERRAQQDKTKIVPVVNYTTGIPLPDMPTTLGQWERQSVTLTVQNEYKDLFKSFKKYFESESAALKDTTLLQEVGLINMLINKEFAPKSQYFSFNS